MDLLPVVSQPLPVKLLHIYLPGQTHASKLRRLVCLHIQQQAYSSFQLKPQHEHDHRNPAATTLGLR